MSRMLLALAFSSMATIALAKDLCVQIDNGSFAGSQLVLKKVKLGRGAVGPLQGYLAIYSSALFSYVNFAPVYGQSLQGSNGVVALGLTRNTVSVSANGYGTGQDSQALNFVCVGSPDRNLLVLDQCYGYVATNVVNGHVIECKDAPPVP